MAPRTSDTSKRPSRHVTEGPSRGGPTGLLEDGDIIVIDADKGTLDVELSAAELEARRNAWKAPNNIYQSGVLRTYANQVGPARTGVVTHAGAAEEVVCHADI